MTAFVVFAIGWLVICEAVKFYRHKPTPLPTCQLNSNDEQWVFYAMKSIGGE